MFVHLLGAPQAIIEQGKLARAKGDLHRALSILEITSAESVAMSQQDEDADA